MRVLRRACQRGPTPQISSFTSANAAVMVLNVGEPGRRRIQRDVRQRGWTSLLRLGVQVTWCFHRE